jgi:hypothetical protein
MSARKPRPPRFTPTTGTLNCARSRATPSRLPSPPDHHQQITALPEFETTRQRPAKSGKVARGRIFHDDFAAVALQALVMDRHDTVQISGLSRRLMRPMVEKTLDMQRPPPKACTVYGGPSANNAWRNRQAHRGSLLEFPRRRNYSASPASKPDNGERSLHHEHICRSALCRRHRQGPQSSGSSGSAALWALMREEAAVKAARSPFSAATFMPPSSITNRSGRLSVSAWPASSTTRCCPPC